jgi:hypothetical protein
LDLDEGFTFINPLPTAIPLEWVRKVVAARKRNAARRKRRARRPSPART